jgi:hypothetical protein
MQQLLLHKTEELSSLNDLKVTDAVLRERMF